MKRPLGHLIRSQDVTREKLLPDIQSGLLTVTVGDATTEKLLSLGFTPDVEIVDSREMRRDRDPPASKYRGIIRASNPAGCLTDEALQAVSEALRSEKPVRIWVKGEEDLMALPVLALYPNGTTVLYGQPKQGLVVLRIDEDIRGVARSLLSKMGVPSLD
ncbi:MAG: GTP-dependent dephospho-CoA kinase family protein [Thaumarchaeota archaeon]|nr:GTP-dependent dephospho-CoA kinase family protein [Nitrososphaerota archaeon]MCL5318473.1 GTP-dependent dephospho-CoA kinase family protein [Nitrososphaerota archaeon]